MAKIPDPIDVEVGGKIKAQRRLVGMSQNTLADRLGVTFQQIQKYEKGTNRVSSSRLAMIADAFGVAPAYFFPGSTVDPGQEQAGTPVSPFSSSKRFDAFGKRKRYRAFGVFSECGVVDPRSIRSQSRLTVVGAASDPWILARRRSQASRPIASTG
jgi:transcriptional regulator with XRE-family HTH domain